MSNEKWRREKESKLLVSSVKKKRVKDASDSQVGGARRKGECVSSVTVDLIVELIDSLRCFIYTIIPHFTRSMKMMRGVKVKRRQSCSCLVSFVIRVTCRSIKGDQSNRKMREREREHLLSPSLCLALHGRHFCLLCQGLWCTREQKVKQQDGEEGRRRFLLRSVKSAIQQEQEDR